MEKINRLEDTLVDLYSCEDVVLPKGESKLVKVAVDFKTPPSFFIAIKDKSPVSEYCDVLSSKVDRSSTGELLVNLYCHSYKRYTEKFSEDLSHSYSSNYKILKGEKICQGIVFKITRK